LRWFPKQDEDSSAIVPSENSVRAFAAAKSPIETAKLKRSGDRLESVDRHKPDVRASNGGSSDTDVEAEQETVGAGQIRVVSGSPSFVAVVQSTDLGHRHD
jgi:hypothetical protein